MPGRAVSWGCPHAACACAAPAAALRLWAVGRQWHGQVGRAFAVFLSSSSNRGGAAHPVGVLLGSCSCPSLAKSPCRVDGGLVTLLPPLHPALSCSFLCPVGEVDPQKTLPLPCLPVLCISICPYQSRLWCGIVVEGKPCLAVKFARPVSRGMTDLSANHVITGWVQVPAHL